jgi:hypothetical protein
MIPMKKGAAAHISILYNPCKKFVSSPVETSAAILPIVIPFIYSKKES